MQRQSLGSPGSKHHIHGGAKEDSLVVADDDPKRKDLLASSSITDYDDYVDSHKATKPHRLSSPPTLVTLRRPHNVIHLIPVLTLLCFLILYLCSHSPSQSDMAQFTGFKWSAKSLESAENEIDDIGRFTELHNGDVLAIRSLRNLQDIGKIARKSRFHRKFADF